MDAAVDQYDFTAFPTGSTRTRLPPIVFSKGSEARVLRTLGDWWSTDDAEGAFNPSVEFRLPVSKTSTETFEVSLHFVRYNHPAVVARLHSGLADDPLMDANGFPFVFNVVRHPRGTKASDPLESVDRIVTAAEENTREFLASADNAFDALVFEAEKEQAQVTRGISLMDMMKDDMGYGDAARRMIIYSTILMKGAKGIQQAYKRSPLYVKFYEDAMWERLRGRVTEKTSLFYERLLAEGFKPARLYDTVVIIKKAKKSGVRPTTRLPGDFSFDTEGAKRTRSEDEDEDIFNTPVKPFSRKNYRLTPEREQEMDALISSLVSAIESSIRAMPIGASLSSSSPPDVLPEIPVACNSCGKAKATQRCARCKTAHYCDRQCQLSHWGKGHSAMCKSK